MKHEAGIRQRFRDVFEFKPVSPAHFEATGFWPLTVDRWRKEGLYSDRSVWEALEIYPIMDNAPAHLSSLTDKVTYPQFFPLFEERVVEETSDAVISIGVDGVLTKQKKDRSSIPQFLAFPVTTPADWDKVKHLLDPDDPGRYRAFESGKSDFVREDEVLRYGVCGCYGFLRSMFGAENLSYAYYDFPELLHEMMRTWLKLYTGVADRICPACDFDYVFIWEDMAFKTGPLVSPKFFKEFMLPYYKDFTTHLKNRHGLDIFCVDSDGNNFPLMDLLLEGGVNMFLPLEIASGMDPVLVRERYPDLVLYGGIDKREIAKGKEAIDREIDKKVLELESSGGYFPALDHHVPPDISLENFLYFLDKVRCVTS